MRMIKSRFNVLIRVLEHALSKVRFSIGTSIYILSSNFNLTIGKTAVYNNKIYISLLSNMKIIEEELQDLSGLKVNIG